MNLHIIQELNSIELYHKVAIVLLQDILFSLMRFWTREFAENFNESPAIWLKWSFDTHQGSFKETLDVQS